MQHKLFSRETSASGLRMILKVLAASIWVAVFSIFYRSISNFRITTKRRLGYVSRKQKRSLIVHAFWKLSKRLFWFLKTAIEDIGLEWLRAKSQWWVIRNFHLMLWYLVMSKSAGECGTDGIKITPGLLLPTHSSTNTYILWHFLFSQKRWHFYYSSFHLCETFWRVPDSNFFITWPGGFRCVRLWSDMANTLNTGSIV